MALERLKVRSKSSALHFILLGFILACSCVGVFIHSVLAENGNFTTFTIPTANSSPTDIIKGPDGNMWFIENGASKISKLTADGTITEYDVPGSYAPWQGLIIGSDNNLWFSAQESSSPNEMTYGKITTDGTVTMFAPPAASQNLSDLAVGPDGNMWFTDFDNNKVGKITTSGTVTQYTVPTSASAPKEITAGPDGNMWFIEQDGKKVGRVTTSGTFTEYAIPSSPTSVSDIIVGPDNNLWFAEQFPAKITRVTTSGIVTEFSPTNEQNSVYRLTQGPNNKIWFVDGTQQKVGSITTSGTVNEYPVSTVISTIVAGVDDNMWLGPQNSSGIIRITDSGQTTFFSSPNLASSRAAAVGQDGNIYYVDSSRSLFNRFDLRPIVSSASTRPTSNGTRILVTGDNFTNLSSIKVGTTDITQSPCPASPSSPCYTRSSETNLEIILPSTLSSASTLEVSNDWGPSAAFTLNPIANDLASLGTLTPYFLGSGRSPWYLGKDTDGNMWVPVFNGPEALIRITPQGTISEFTNNIIGGNMYNPVAGPDGNIWFTKANTNQVSNLNPNNGIVTDYDLPTNTFVSEMTAGPDNALWFNARDPSGGIVTRVATDGTMNEYPLGGASNAYAITTGPDNAIWSTRSDGTITRITTDGTTTDQYTIPNNDIAFSIVTGPDGNLWMGADDDKIIRMTPSGSFTVFTVPTFNCNPVGLTVGPDGNIWFSEQTANKIGRITPDGVITEFAFSSSDDFAPYIVAGNNNDLWFTSSDSVYRLALNSSSTPTPNPEPEPQPQPQNPPSSSSTSTQGLTSDTSSSDNSDTTSNEQPTNIDLTNSTDFLDGSGTNIEVTPGDKITFAVPGLEGIYTLAVNTITSHSVSATISSPTGAQQSVELLAYRPVLVDINNDKKNDLILKAARLDAGKATVTFALYKNTAPHTTTKDNPTVNTSDNKSSFPWWILWALLVLLAIGIVIAIIRQVSRSKSHNAS